MAVWERLGLQSKVYLVCSPKYLSVLSSSRMGSSTEAREMSSCRGCISLHLVLHDCFMITHSTAPLLLACPARVLSCWAFCGGRARGACVLNQYGNSLPKTRELSAAVSAALLGLVQLYKELQSSLGLFSRIRGLLCGSIMPMQAQQDAPAFLQC